MDGKKETVDYFFIYFYERPSEQANRCSLGAGALQHYTNPYLAKTKTRL
jgi:hypothetical protein